MVRCPVGRSAGRPGSGIRGGGDDGDPAAVQGDRPAGDGQAETGPAVRRLPAPRRKRSKTASHCSRGIPGPSSVTSRIRPPSAARRPATSTRPPAGECRAALSTRLTSTWRSRAGSASAPQPGRDVDRDRRVRGAPASDLPGRRRGPAARPVDRRRRSGATPGLGPGQVEQVVDQLTEPLHLVEELGQGLGRRPARTPSTRFSSWARTAATGVRSSWPTLASRSLRCASAVARSRAIAVNARASSPTSSRLVAGTGRAAGRRPSPGPRRSSAAAGRSSRARAPG